MRSLNFLSVVVPCYNEQEVLGRSHARLTHVLQEAVRNRKILRYEIVYVNDGSKDGTRDVLEKIFNDDLYVRVIDLRRNFGFQSALSAGLVHAEGDAVVTIDCDLQDPPEKIPEMIDLYAQGYDLVLGVRQERRTDPFFKRMSAEAYYRILGCLGVEVVYNHGDFRFMARPLVDEFNRLPERNRFIRAMVLKLDDHYATVSYAREKRAAGTSKFGLLKMLSLCFDGIFSFSIVPLRAVTFLGSFMCFFAFIGIVWVLYLKLTGHTVLGWASTVLPVMLLGGIQLIVLGIIGEYIGRLYTEVKERPLFSVRRELRKS